MSMNILLVEDEEGLIITLTDRLVSEGFDVTSANDGKKGFDAALAGHFDLIILDVMLPKKNGYDVCRDLRQKGVNTPILSTWWVAPALIIRTFMPDFSTPSRTRTSTTTPR